MILDPELRKHIESLGLSSIEEYIRWCKQNGFGSGLNKNIEVRSKEIQFVKNQAIEKAFAQGREKHKPLAAKLKQSQKNNSLEIIDLEIKKYAELAEIKKTDNPDFLSFLALVDKKTKILKDKTDKFFPGYPVSKFNKTLFALAKMFQYRNKWVRKIEDWEPETKNIHRQLSSLLRFLFTKYKLPIFLDSVWFCETETYRQWFLDLAEGKNIRKVDNLPLILTKMQAHKFLEAPDNYNIYQALRYGQIMGMTDDKRLVEVVIQKNTDYEDKSIMGVSFKNEEFWFDVIRLFINNPMLDRNEYGSVVDYIRTQKFVPNAPHPTFCMKGRTAETLMNQVEVWHSKVSKEKGKNYLEWRSIGISNFTKEEIQKNEINNWEISELLNSKELAEEGRVLSHCVSSYKYSAFKGSCSIWSLRHNTARAVTIEVNNHSQTIVQVRGKSNRLVNSKEARIIREWAESAKLNINCSGF